MKKLLDKTKEINKLIQKAACYSISFKEMARFLCKNINANTYIIGRKGKVVGYDYIENFHCPIMEEIVKKKHTFLTNTMKIY